MTVFLIIWIDFPKIWLLEIVNICDYIAMPTFGSIALYSSMYVVCYVYVLH